MCHACCSAGHTVTNNDACIFRLAAIRIVSAAVRSTRINLGYIDVLQMHYILSAGWNTELSDYMTAFDKLKQKGVIRAHGLSCHALAALETAVGEPWTDAIHVRINPYGINMDDSAEKVEPVVRQLHEAGRGVIAMKVLGEGALANSDEQRDQSFRYVLQLGAVDLMTVGMIKISDIIDTEERIRKVPLVKS